MAKALIDSPIGAITVIANDVGVCRVWFGDLDEDVNGTSVADAIVTLAVLQLREYFDGQRTDFNVPIDRSQRLGFRGEVLSALETVPFGSTITYGALATRAGRPNAARAVGTAMATNAIGIIVPCHRVLPSSGGVGQFGGGVLAKEWLLRREGSLD
ncbi:MAG: methylated-DNA--[protein]-cysteine S-methyltransferase [Actinomycetota bacterium]